MQPGTKYRAYMHVWTSGVGEWDAIYDIAHLDINLLSAVTKISGFDSANAFCRVFGGGVAGAVSAGNGNQFDFVLNAATITGTATYTLELEML